MESVQQLLKRVSKVGIKPAYLERVLPPWVTDYPPETETGLIELKVLLAKELGLDLDSLDENQKVTFGALPTVPRFKRVRTGDVARLRPAASMFYSLARALITSCAQAYVPLPDAPSELRAEILAANGSVTLSGLLDALWRHGIPVAHYSDWPDQLSRPAGMAVDVGGRPVIILGSARKESAWHAFHVAHEIGHVAKGHVGRDQMIVDDENSSLGFDSDDQEKEADDYALRLMSGLEQVAVPDAGGISQVEKSLKELSKQLKIDRGHLALRFGMQTDKWPMAITILQHMEPASDAPALINQDFARDQLDLGQLSEERQAFLQRVLAI